MRAAENTKLKAVNDFLSMESLADSNGLATSEAKRMLDKERAAQILPRIGDRADTIEKMHEHIRNH